MKKHFKTLRERGLALFLAFVMCFSLLPAQAMAQDAGTAGAENTYSICDNADNCIQQLQEWLNGKAAGTSISIEVQADIWFNQTLNIPAGLDVTVYANDGTIRRDTEGGFSCPMFSVPAGAKLTLRNVTIESRDKTNNTPDSGASMVVVNGGECVLGSGAKLAEGRFYNGDGPKKGGAVYLDGGKFTMQKGSTIEHCGAKDAGGAVYVAKGEFIAESGATIGECWVGTQKQGTKVYVAEGATFKNAAGIDGVRDANDNLPDQFVDEWLVITILRNNPNSNGIPSEPSTVGGCTWDHLMKSNDGYTIATTGDQWNLTFTKNPAEVVKTEILNSPEYIASTNVNDHAWGVADSTGVKTKEWLKLDEAFWSKYLDVLARENRYQVIGANNVLTDTLNNANKEQYKVVPYVVKYQDNGNNYDGWHIDCAVIPKDSLQLTYNLNLPNGVSTNISGFGLPLTVIGIPGAETVEAKPVGTLYFNNAQVTPVDSDGTTDSATPIRAKYQNEDITLLFKGWSTTPDGIGQSLYRPGADASFNETTTLYAQWTQTPPFSITYDGLENSTFADNNPNPTSYSIVTPTFTLRNPTKEGYKFLGWTGTGLDRATETVTIEQGSTGNRSYTATWEAIKAAKLSVSKVAKVNGVEVTEAKPGQTITYTITVTNSGNGAAEKVLLKDVFSGTGLVWTSDDPTAKEFGVAAQGETGDTVEFTATYEVQESDAGKKITNSAVLKDDPDPTTPQTTVEVKAAKLAVSKSATNAVKVGENIVYTIIVENTGTAAANNVAIYDLLDSSVEFKNVTLNGADVRYTFNAETNAIHVAVGNLVPGDKAELVITTTANAAGTVTNKANASSKETGSKDSNVVTTTVTEDIPVVPELTIAKDADKTSAKLNDVITFSVKVTNSGNVVLTDVIVADPMMENGQTVIPSLAAGAEQTITYTHTVTETDVLAGQVINTATVSGTNPDGPAPKEETSTVVVTIPDQAEKINVTWVDGYNGDILKELPGVYDKGTTTIPKDQYPSVPAHAGYTFEQWTSQVLGNGDIIITANYRTLEVNPGGPSFEDLTNLGITVEVVCDTNATHGPETRSYPLMEGSYETFVANGSCTLVIYNDLYVEAYGGDHSLVGRPAQTIMLEYVGTPAPISDDETAGDETIDAGSNADSEDESTDNVVDNNVDNDADVTTPDAGAEAGSEDSGITDTSSEETGNGNLIDDDSGDEAGAGDGNVDAGLLENDINNDEPIQLMSVEAISFSAPTVTGRWAIAEGYTNTVTFYVRCEEPAARTHTVTWVNWNGDVLQQMDNVANDVNIPSSAYTNATPVRPADAGYTYTFSGWSAPSVDANGNVTYTALYDRTAIVRTHTVTWVNWNGIVLQQMDNVANGVNIPSSAYTNATPVRPADAEYTYTFSGWSAPSVDRDGNVTYVAQYTPSRIPEEGPVVPVPPVTPVTPVTPTPGPTVIPDNPTPLDPGTTITDDDVPLAGAVGLNDVDHFAYIIGYDEDHVRPLNNITRAEVATIFFRLMTDEYRNANWSTSNDFSDVQAGSWYNNAISTCANAGALNGYADGSFKPNASITRAEFAAIAARFLSDEYTDDGTGDFSDTANHWAAKEIRLAAKAGWVRGDGNKFRPNDPITRAEVMTIVNRMLDRVPDADHMLETMKKWVDNPEDAWYYEAVQEATNEHAYERDADLGVIETWTEILEVRDWKALEESWANANT